MSCRPLDKAGASFLDASSLEPNHNGLDVLDASWNERDVISQIRPRYWACKEDVMTSVPLHAFGRRSLTNNETDACLFYHPIGRLLGSPTNR